MALIQKPLLKKILIQVVHYNSMSYKKAGEVFLKTYNYLYNFPIVCLRFFTVYGPWGRPDMAIFSFTKNILLNKRLIYLTKENLFEILLILMILLME